jgi:hypothetical protein
MMNKIKSSTVQYICNHTTVQYICNHSIIYLSDMTYFIHSNLDKSKPRRKFIRLTQQCDISAQEKNLLKPSV